MENLRRDSVQCYLRRHDIIDIRLSIRLKTMSLAYMTLRQRMDFKGRIPMVTIIALLTKCGWRKDVLQPQHRQRGTSAPLRTTTKIVLPPLTVC